MKKIVWMLAISLAASAWAQTPAAKPQAAPTPGKPIAVSAKVAGPAAPGRTVVAPSAKQQKPSAGLAKATAPNRVENGSTATAATKTGAAKTLAARARRGKGQRDPFVSPITQRARTGPVCTGTGKRCLYVGDLSLLGIVESDQGVIAVVASGNRTYFLREHEPLADGDVEKITRNAITMRQRSSDLLGRPVVRQVVRKLGGPAV